MFDIDKFNIISDEEYYYAFRSLEAGDIKDINNGIENVIRTDRERCQGYTKYSKDSQISLNIPLEQLIEEYIEMLADDRIKKIIGKDSIIFNIDGKQIIRKVFWANNSEKIIIKLQEEKYRNKKYDIVRKKIKRYVEKNETVFPEKLIEEYIEMLADDRIKEIKSKDSVTFNVEGQEITRKTFWNSKSTKIKEKLQEEKYNNPKYDIAKAKVEAALNIKQNKEKIEQLCNEFGIDYKKNKKYLDKLSYDVLKMTLTYLKEEGKMYDISDIWMSSKDFKEKHGKSFEELFQEQKRK